MSMRDRFHGWLHPTIAVPTRPAPVAADQLDRLAGITVIETRSGLSIPVGHLRGWSVLEVVRTLGQIDRLPEVTP